ncbi:hypothetical protein HGRIS_011684 [Hohenbuehelia grisea]|uniref:Uncharacterized protein n=1 Tax=Hohenbuehelia grisea TaxID=104357 RepID=A0ABR3JWY0_9AGAR
MATRPRSFTVFVDQPTGDIPKPPTNKRLPLSSSLSAPTLPTAALFNKENVNPLTGERSSNATGKKRKENALTSKVTTPLAVKPLPAPEVSKPEKKKRKSSTSSSSTKEKGGEKSKKGSSSRKALRRSPRRVATLPRLEEDVEAEVEKEKERVSQAEVDSKCYDLTVKPLADVSAAYGSFELPRFSPAKSKFNFVKDSSVEPEIGDFSTSFGTNFLSKDTSRATSPSDQETLLATPERKRIYAFTFSSPSPTSEKFRKMARATSVPAERPVRQGLSHPASSP